MGMLENKDDMEEAVSRWEDVARDKAYYCERCGSIPPYEERETYFSTKLCSWCLNQAQKDD
jgi:adenine-specific DNA methylase